MTGMESSADDLNNISRDQRIRLWVTLIVATLMVAMTAYVLSFALLGPSNNAPPHRSAAAMIRAHS